MQPLGQSTEQEPVALTARAERPANVASMSIHRGLAVFYAVLAVFALAFAAPREAGGAAVVVLLVCAIHSVIAFGAARRARWARLSSMVVACLMLVAVPIGTVIGIYLLRNLNWKVRADA